MAQIQSHGIEADQDVSIRLVRAQANNQRVTSLRSRGTWAQLKVHSSELKNCSRYFEACLSNRWTNPNSSMEFYLEMIHGLLVPCYEDCFSRMYTPFRKDFKDVKSSLELLQVASQIDFHGLISSIYGYLSAIKWTEEDELRIRQHSSSPGFARSQAKGLVARLGSEVDDRRRVVCDLIEKAIQIALYRDTHDRLHQHIMSWNNARSFLEELFSSIGQSASDATFEKDMVMIVSKVTKEMLVEFREECRNHATFDDLMETVSEFGRKLEAICWILKKLLRALTAAGNLLFGKAEQIALLESWNLIYAFDVLSRKYDEFLYDCGVDQASDDEVFVFSFQKQVELIIQAREDMFLTLLNPK